MGPRSIIFGAFAISSAFFSNPVIAQSSTAAAASATSSQRSRIDSTFYAFPTCIRQCISDAYLLAGCPSDPTGKCKCSGQKFIPKAGECARANCNETDAALSKEFSGLMCRIDNPFDEKAWDEGVAAEEKESGAAEIRAILNGGLVAALAGALVLVL